MILTADKIRSLINTRALIDPGPAPEWETEESWADAWQRRCSWIEGAAFDLALEGVEQHKNEQIGEIFKEFRVVPETVPSPIWENRPEPSWLLRQGRFYQFRTIETICMPPWLTGILDSKRTVIGNDAILTFAPVHPGFIGKLVVGCYVVAPGIHVGYGARFMTIRFAEYDEELSLVPASVDPYQGVWGGSKMHTSGQPERPF